MKPKTRKEKKKLSLSLLFSSLLFLSSQNPTPFFGPATGLPFPDAAAFCASANSSWIVLGGGRIRSITPYSRASSALKYLLRLKSRWTSAMGLPVALQSTALT